MKSVLKSTLCFLIATIVFSCSDQPQSLKEYSINDIINNSNPITLSDMGAEIKTIKLKLPDDIILSQAAKIVTTPSYIFIQSRKPLQVYRFDRDGNYLNKISMQGRARNEYNGINTIFTDHNENLCIQDRNDILTFTPQGEFLSTREMVQVNKGVQPDGFAMSGSSMREMYMDTKGNIFESFIVLIGNEVNNLIVTNPEGDTLLASLNPIRYDFAGSISIFNDNRSVYSVGDEIAYHQQFRDTVFTFDPNTSSLTPRFHLQSSPPFTNEDYKSMHKALKGRTYVDDITEDSKYIYAKISIGEEKQLYLIDKKSGESFNPEFGLNHSEDEDLAFYPTWESNGEFIFYYDVTEQPEPTIILMKKL